MDFSIVAILATPVTWLLLAAAAFAVSRFRRKHALPRNHRGQVRARRGGEAALALQFLGQIYRPSLAHVAKAQIQQQEDTDEDDNGDPETPLKHLHRQLRRIRRGEHVERLQWRLE